MAKLIRAFFSLFWLGSTLFIGFLVYIVLQTEPNPQALWGWLVMCGFTFVSATFLAYNIIFGGQDKSDAHDHTDPQNH